MTDNSTGHAVPDEGAASPRWRHVTEVSDYYLAEFDWDGVRVERDPRTGRWIVLTPGVYEAVPLRETFTELRDARAAAFAELGCEPPPDTASPDGDVAERAKAALEDYQRREDDGVWPEGLLVDLVAEVERVRADRANLLRTTQQIRQWAAEPFDTLEVEFAGGDVQHVPVVRADALMDLLDRGPR